MERWSPLGAHRNRAEAGEEPEDLKRYEYFRVTGANDSVEIVMPIYLQSLFEMTIFRVRYKMRRNFIVNGTISTCCFLEKLYKLRIRGSEKLKTVLELYNMEIHQKKAGPDHHRLKTMVKTSIEQNLRMKKFEARNGNFEISAEVKNQRAKKREQRSLGDCLQWKSNGQCVKGDNCSCRHDTNKRAKSTQPNPSPRSSTQQNERNASRTRSPRGKSQWKNVSTVVQGLP